MMAHLLNAFYVCWTVLNATLYALSYLILDNHERYFICILQLIKMDC